MVVIDAVECDV